jgi:signal transduction histidine kinase
VLENEVEQRQALETALRDALRAQARVEKELRAWVRRETEARERAQASDAFKEMFLSILGHDLRNPLNTVLTTARLMRMREGLPAEADRRLDRIVHAGSRMERMIGQLLDVARARLDNGIPVSRTESHDLRALVMKKVEETRAARPDATIAVEADAVCSAFVDADRLQQVVSNLVDNAVIHGDLRRPVTVRLTAHDGTAVLSVHNFGHPIPTDILPTLFDPFATVNRSRGQVDRLGLGLYIVERIVRAHGGDVRVDSTAEGGTRFEVMLPICVRA